MDQLFQSQQEPCPHHHDGGGEENLLPAQPPDEFPPGGPEEEKDNRNHEFVKNSTADPIGAGSGIGAPEDLDAHPEEDYRTADYAAHQPGEDQYQRHPQDRLFHKLHNPPPFF